MIMVRMMRVMRVMRMMTRLFPRMMRVSTELLDWEVNQGAMDALLDTSQYTNNMVTTLFLIILLLNNFLHTFTHLILLCFLLAS